MSGIVKPIPGTEPKSSSLGHCDLEKEYQNGRRTCDAEPPCAIGEIGPTASEIGAALQRTGGFCARSTPVRSQRLFVTGVPIPRPHFPSHVAPTTWLNRDPSSSGPPDNDWGLTPTSIARTKYMWSRLGVPLGV